MTCIRHDVVLRICEGKAVLRFTKSNIKGNLEFLGLYPARNAGKTTRRLKKKKKFPMSNDVNYLVPGSCGGSGYLTNVNM